MEISCVIANYQGARFLGPCLESLAAQEPKPAAVFVVDAGSTDGSVGIAHSFGVEVIKAENRGLGHLYNVGAARTWTPLVFLGNNDIELERGCLTALGAALAGEPRRFAADPTQLRWEDGQSIHARTALAPGWRPLLLQPLEPATGVTPTVAANAGAMLVRRDLFLELGGFDDTFFLDWEDVDLAWRAWLRGWESVYVPSATVRHHVGGSDGSATISRRRSISSRHNKMRFALKCLPPNVAVLTVMVELSRGAKHPVTTATAAARIARSLPAILGERRRVAPSRALYQWLRRGQHGACPLRPAP